jgi:NADH dehydrogenase FAD-containing subunit
VALVCGGPLLAAHSASLRRHVRRALQARAVAVHEVACRAIERDRVVLDGGTSLVCDLAIVATGSTAPAWLRGSGLALDAEGFVATGPTLQSLSHPDVFAAGDVASRADAKRPRNGVHAVRAGPPLARNLRLHLDGRPGRPHRPQRHTLALLACGDGRAIAEWRGWSFEGEAIGRWKDRIDREFVALNRAA